MLVTGPDGLTVTVEACTDLGAPTWTPVQSLTLTGGSAWFHDPQWTDATGRFYRVHSP